MPRTSGDISIARTTTYNSELFMVIMLFWEMVQRTNYCTLYHIYNKIFSRGNSLVNVNQFTSETFFYLVF